MKVRISTVIRLWILILVAIEADLFENLGIDLKLEDILCVVSPVLLYIICKYTPSINRYTKRLDRYLDSFVILYFIYFIVEAVYTFLTYRSNGISLYYIIRLNMFLLYILLAYPLFYLYQVDRGMTKMLKWFLFFALVGNTIRFISYFAYNNLGTVLFKDIVPLFERNIRRGRNRLGASLLHTLGFNIALAGIAYDKKFRDRFILLLSIVFFVFYQITISQGRSQEACYAITILFSAYYVYARKSNNQNSRILKGMFIFGIVVIGGYIIANDVLADYFNSFTNLNLGNEYAGSSLQRLYAVNYYWSRVKNQLLFGLGFLYNEGGAIGSILRGTSTAYAQTAYTEDLGILGQFFNYGILGVSFFIALFVRWFSVMRKSYKAEYKKYFALLLPLFIHGLTQTITSMSLFQRNKFMYVPIYISIFEYVSWFIKENELTKREVE